MITLKKPNSPAIKRAVKELKPLIFTTHAYTHEEKQSLEKILEIFLAEIGQKKIFIPLSYCLKELLENAKKANLKRIYFKEKGLRIDNEQDYKTGMKSFRDDLLAYINEYHNKLKANDFHSKVVLQNDSKAILISVINNSLITRNEKNRITEKINHSQKYNSLEDLFTGSLDKTEGAGLGLIITMLLLKKIGISDNCFSIYNENERTIARIVIPFKEIMMEEISNISEKLIKEIDALPQFPESIKKIQKKITDEKTSLSNIALLIRKDLSITANLLKLANSAFYMVPKKVNTVEKALKIVGFKGLRGLLLSLGIQKVFKEKYGEMRAIWKHSHRVAFYAAKMAIDYNKKSIIDDVYTAGLLHDIGKVVIEFLHPAFLENIKTFCFKNNISEKAFEEFSIGVHHSEIGALVAEKWNFPNQLIATIRYHHDPTRGSAVYRDVIELIYLANSICDVTSAGLTYDQINPMILKRYNLDSEENFKKQVKNLVKLFQKEE